MADLDEARERMVTEQLVKRGIGDARVLDAIRRVPRHQFVPPGVALLAYTDRALPIAEGQTISQPYMVAAMAEAMDLHGDERVLEIGTGSGYQAAVLSELAREVITIERHEGLAAAARLRLATLGYGRVNVIVGDGTVGYQAAAPYGAILVTAGAPHVPDLLKSQLAEGGRLVIPVGSREHQELTVIRRRGDAFTQSTGEACVFVPLVGEDGWPA